MKFLIALALGSILHPDLKVRDIDGVERAPFKVDGKATALFFVTSELRRRFSSNNSLPPV